MSDAPTKPRPETKYEDIPLSPPMIAVSKRGLRPSTLVSRLAAEGRRIEFRKYISKSGIMDSLAKVLLSLYEEGDKPFNALEYMYDKMASDMPIRLQMDNLEMEKDRLEEKVSELEAENQRLRDHMKIYEHDPEFDSEVDGEYIESDEKSSDPEQE